MLNPNQSRRQPNWTEAHWDLFWYVFHTNHTRTTRKECIRSMISRGLTPFEAISEMRATEKEG